MPAFEKRPPSSLLEEMIAPCGMDCALCSAYSRKKKPCPGCRGADEAKPVFCVSCVIANCPDRHGDYCLGCRRLPCARMRRLDARYKNRYGMSMLENLAYVQEHGVEALVSRERERWTCPGCGLLLCVHKPACLHCGWARENAPRL
jgi:hypothetical protein